MTQAYFTEDQKMAHIHYPQWTPDECYQMHEILESKGYNVNCVYRVGCDRKFHDAWQIPREDIPRVIEELFRQRITVEVQAEGNGMASVNFVYDYHASTILDAVSRFRRYKK